MVSGHQSPFPLMELVWPWVQIGMMAVVTTVVMFRCLLLIQ